MHVGGHFGEGAHHRRENLAEAVEYGLVGARGAQRRKGDDLLGDQEMIKFLGLRAVGRRGLLLALVDNRSDRGVVTGSVLVATRS